MDEALKAALDELEEAERDMSESGEDTDDRLYTAACQVAYRWRELKKPKPTDLSPRAIGIAFSLDPLGDVTVSKIDR